ncbi:ferric reductase-like transmembrane component [Lasiosphaeria hispida]|uniref:Ferric reductase-like transmembrane component n=1 Tax=Lasiosphaeria hispida TaxID=260671 RepID=A0AAJ0HKP6_9PEZI|nr:ferric reductase-like transmembrane component [Lasiosphaeria hispida]
MRALILMRCVLLLGGPTLAQDFLVGYGNYPYDPICAQSCLQAFRPYLLNCSDLEAAKKPFDPLAPATAPSCYAEDTPFLTSVAWCFGDKCPEESVAKLEGYWQQSISGSKGVPPKWTYSVALDKVDPRPPSHQLTFNETQLNRTSLVVENSYLSSWNGMSALYEEDVNESKFGIIILVMAIGLPIILTWVRVLPFAERILDQIKPYVIYPSTFGTYHTRQLPFRLGNVPTLGQTLYIIVFTILNILLAAVDYNSLQPNAFFLAQYKEVVNYICIRTGAFAFVLLPILLLFSSRNNILLYLSDWTHSTFFLLHRWVARLFMVYAVIHSITALQIYRFFENTSWWAWGIVATVLTVVMTVGSGLYMRKAQYELFLISHVALAVLVIAGSWYHLIGWYAYLGKTIARKNTLGYELWLYFAIAVWFFDRLVRFGRVVRWGPQKAAVTELGGGYVRVDVPGVRWGTEPGRHAFVHFPTLRPWAPWENHPFSIVPTGLLNSLPRETNPSRPVDEEEKQLATSHTRTTIDTSAGVTLFIKKSAGITSHLKSNSNLLTLLDGPYASNSKREVLRCDRVLLIAGGIGITGVLPWAHSHLNVKLVWSVKEAAHTLVEVVNLGGVVSKEVRIGSRFNVEELIFEEENAGWARVGVVVCGPGSLCDDTRAAVVAAGRKGKTVFELEVDAFSW